MSKKKILKANNKNVAAKRERNAKGKEKKGVKVEVVAVGEPKMLPYDLDLSTVRASAEKNTDKRFVTFFVTDKKSDTEIRMCEHVDHISKELRKALEAAEII